MIYIFDGTYSGLLTCIFESFEYKHTSVTLQVNDTGGMQSVLFTAHRTVETNGEKANRVLQGLEKKIGKSTAADFYRCFLSEDIAAWNAAFKIAVKLFNGQQTILQNYGDADVLYFSQTLKKVSRERHRMKAFIRFSKSSDGMYFAMVEPDFNVLPLIMSFFKNRYSDQKWLIYDVKRGYGLLYDLKNVTEVSLTAAEKNALSTEETIAMDESDEHFQQLWKRYFKSTNIEARRNMKLHLQHVPKRYWKYLVEKQA